jgi:6-phosphogluconolactonase (cycloisomerase 2 family)
MFVRDNSLEFGIPTLIHVYAITGDLSFPEVPSSPSQPDITPVAIDPTGKFIFALATAEIITLQISPSGALIETSTTSDFNAIYGYIHPSGQFLYVFRKLPTTNSYDLDVYKIDSTGALTLSTTEQNFGNQFFTFHPSGKFVFSLACTTYPCSLQVLPIDPTTGVISTAPTYSLPQWSQIAALDATGARLFAVSAGNDCSVPGKLTLFSVGVHGSLKPTGATAQTDPCPGAVVVTQ